MAFSMYVGAWVLERLFVLLVKAVKSLLFPIIALA